MAAMPIDRTVTPMRFASILIPALLFLSLGCQPDDEQREPVEEPGIVPDGEDDSGDGDVGQPDDGVDPNEPESNDELEPDEWIGQLDYVIATANDNGFRLTGYNGFGDEIGWIVVIGAHEFMAIEHRYFRPCEFNEIDCYDAAATIFGFAADPVTEVDHTIPLDVVQKRAKAMVVLAGEHPQPFNKHLKCALTLISPLVECGIVGDFNPDTCIGSILAALCACRDSAKKIFPGLNLERLKQLCDD